MDSFSKHWLKTFKQNLNKKLNLSLTKLKAKESSKVSISWEFFKNVELIFLN